MFHLDNCVVDLKLKRQLAGILGWRLIHYWLALAVICKLLQSSIELK